MTLSAPYMWLHMTCRVSLGEHQMELIDAVAAKFHEEPGVFKLLVSVLEIASTQSTVSASLDS